MLVIRLKKRVLPEKKFRIQKLRSLTDSRSQTQESFHLHYLSNVKEQIMFTSVKIELRSKK